MLIFMSNFLYCSTMDVVKIDAAPQFWRQRIVSEGQGALGDVASGSDRTALPALHDHFHFYFIRRCPMQVGRAWPLHRSAPFRHRIVHVPGR
ncbi:hypothetical protein FPJ27_30625 [Burkholderia sp. MS455]|uniref:hypothetical protein n=1 Tax=Burkholderia sp. MS455 TaxID=2811788 RepID=UPI00195C0A67|nr:hypothetical protein [Burkholderia sp. MS455]QRR10522.1 hypothetical protein FPJ27_30625 [Burkholderia sp. MS455]